MIHLPATSIAPLLYVMFETFAFWSLSTKLLLAQITILTRPVRFDLCYPVKSREMVSSIIRAA